MIRLSPFLMALALPVAGAAASKNLIELPQVGNIPLPQKAPERPNPQPIKRDHCPAIQTGLIKADYEPAIAKGRCGHDLPIKVTALDGGNIVFSRAAIINCELATKLNAWIKAVNVQAQDRFGAAITRIENGPGYQCRHRYRDPNKKLSEHALANALDIFGFDLADGTKINLLRDWPKKSDDKGSFLRTAHKTACTQFTTVLGPDYNAAHKNHFHLDLQCHGRDCSYLVCD